LTKLQARAERAGLALYKFIFYLSSGVVGYLILKDTPLLPGALGGSGSIEGIFIELPYQKQLPYLLEFSLFQMGYVIEDLMHHLCFRERTSDFWEMTLHHLLTLTLYGGMIM
jgi:hypothetical protein